MKLMAVSAFRSTSKRGNIASSSNSSSSAKESNSGDLGKKIPHGRSRSVSAVSRSYSEISLPSSVVEFSNKRDNPLFSNSSPSPPDELEHENVIGISKFPERSVESARTLTKPMGSGVPESRRGRSVSRSSDVKNQLPGTRTEYGRSLSRVDTRRRQRSLSRGHYGNSKKEVEEEYQLSSSFRNTNNGSFRLNDHRNSDKVTNASDSAYGTRNSQTPTKVTNSTESAYDARNSQTWSSCHPLSEPSDGLLACALANWDDGISTSSYSEAEERTIKAVFAQMKPFQSDHPAGGAATDGIYETVRSEIRRAVSDIRDDLENVIQRKNPGMIAAANIADIPPELVNPDALELVSDIRRQYATKLEQSQERARKLRADLAIEEQRGQELSRILKQIIPDPKTSESQKSRPRRKASIERRKVSERLAEEAMNYFDECVSLSTFDSSDFSAPEDPSFGSVTATPMSGNRILSRGSSGASITHSKEVDSQSRFSISTGSIDPSASSSTETAEQADANGISANHARSYEGYGGGIQFSTLAAEADGLHDIQSFIKKFEKNFQKGQITRSSYNADDYKENVSAEKLLFDLVIFQNRIKYGGLLICDIRI
ncbi:hypothetical protein ACLOJK_025013 [Asimina triloba]